MKAKFALCTLKILFLLSMALFGAGFRNAFRAPRVQETTNQANIPREAYGFSLVGSLIKGPSFAIAVSDNYSFLGVGGMVFIIDISNPAQPKKVTEVKTPGVVSQLVNNGHYLYAVLRNTEGLFIIDVGKPENPKGIFHYSNNMVHAVAVEGNYAYLACKYSLVVLDITDPAYPTQKSQLNLQMPEALSISIKSNIAYVGGIGKLVLVDISDPSHPTIAGTPYLGIDALNNMYIKDNKLYITYVRGGIKIYDISDPSNPAFLNTIKNNQLGLIGPMFVDSCFLYEACGHLLIFDVTNPNSPQLITDYQSAPGYVGDIDVKNKYAYTANEWAGMSILDVSDVNNPIKKAVFDSVSSYAFRFSFDNNLCFLVTRNGGYLKIIDVNDPTNPLERSSLYSSNWFCIPAITTAKNYCYVDVVDQLLQDTVYIVQIADPGHPQISGIVPTSGYITSLLADSSYLYLGDSTGLKIFDISSPLHPVRIGSSSSVVRNIHVSGNLLYASTLGDTFLQIFDISDKTTPKEISAVKLELINGVTMAIERFFVQNNFIYVVSGNMVFIVDAKDSTTPTQINIFDQSLVYFKTIFVKDSLAYVGGEKGLQILNVSDPLHIVQQNVYYTPDVIEDIYVGKDDNIYLANANYGLVILKYSGLGVGEVIKKLPAKSSIRLNPIPARNFVIVEFNSSQLPRSLSMFDATGRMIKTYSINPGVKNLTINFQKDHIGSGVYFFGINPPDIFSSKKIIIIN